MPLMALSKQDIQAFLISGLGKDIVITTATGAHATRGVFIEPSVEDVFSDIGPTADSPAIHIAAEDLDRFDIDEGDALKIENHTQTYTIRDIQPDGEGFAELILRNA